MPVPDPADPLGVDPILSARRTWDAEDAASRRRWDEILGPDPVLTPPPAPPSSAPPPAPPDPPAATAGEQDHSNPWDYAGEDADPPTDTGRPPDPRTIAVPPGGWAY